MAGAYCGKLLADQGATVTLVRSSDPSVGQADPALGDASIGLAPYLHSAKTIHNSSGDDLTRSVASLSAGVDIVILSDAAARSTGPSPSPLLPMLDEARAANPAMIVVEISPFGRRGPYAGFRSNDLIEQAISGHLHLNGDPDREPVSGPQHQVAMAVGVHAAIGAVAAALARRTTGAGQDVEVTHHEVMVALHQFTLLRYTHAGDVLCRMGNRYAGPGHPIGAYQCSDGVISLVVPRDDQLDRLLGVAGLDHLLEQPGIESTYDLMHHPTLLDEHLAPWLAEQQLDETVELLQALRVPAGPVKSMADVLADEQLRARDFWRPLDVDGFGADTVRVDAPGPAFQIFPADSPSADSTADADAGVERDLADGPLGGLRVLDLTRVWAGPLATRVLGDLGADVIMIEAPWARGPVGIDQSSVVATHYYPDDDPGDEHWNRIGFINKYAINKRSVALDLSAADGLAAFETMVAESDVVIENFSPRVMPQFGLDEQRLHELNPGLIYVTMPGFGRTGPALDRVAYGPMIDSHAGLSVLQGYRNEPARKGGVAWPDPVAGLHAAYATIVGLLGREPTAATGTAGSTATTGSTEAQRGATIEIAQLEATVAMVGHALVQSQLLGTEPERLGNRHPTSAPQGVYRCAGTDRWLALSVVDDESWAALCAIAGFDAPWSAWDEAKRREHHDLIDEAVTSWSGSRDHVEAMDALQTVGVTAAAVADAEMVMADPHLNERDFFVELDHVAAGRHRWPRTAVHLSGTPTTYRRAAPLLNEQADQVLTEVARLDPSTIASLRAAGTISDRPPS